MVANPIIKAKSLLVEVVVIRSSNIIFTRTMAAKVAGVRMTGARIMVVKAVGVKEKRWSGDYSGNLTQGVAWVKVAKSENEWADYEDAFAKFKSKLEF